MDDLYKGFLWGIGTMLIVILAGVVAFLVFFNDSSSKNGYPVLNYSTESNDVLKENYDAFQIKQKNILETLDKNFYENVNMKDVYEGAYKGMVEALNDPYTHYYTAEEMSQIVENHAGEYIGIGCGIGQLKDSNDLVVLYTYEGSPCEKAGMLTGDILIAIDDKSIVGMDIDSASNLISGAEGTPVKITVKRDKEKIDLEMVRGKIEYKMVAYKMLEDNIGYIYIAQFYSHTAEQFKAALEDLEKQGMEKLILDLRENPGGYYNIALDMLDRILEKNLLAAYTESKDGSQEKSYTKDDESFDKPMVILINENSASSSELFTQTLRDYEKATIIGTTSFGKGVYQDFMYVGKDGSGIRVTGGRFYSGKGVCVHGTGIVPDIVVELDPEYEKTTPSKRDTDNQIRAAIDFLKNK